MRRTDVNNDSRSQKKIINVEQLLSRPLPNNDGAISPVSPVTPNSEQSPTTRANDVPLRSRGGINKNRGTNGSPFSHDNRGARLNSHKTSTASNSQNFRTNSASVPRPDSTVGKSTSASPRHNIRVMYSITISTLSSLLFLHYPRAFEEFSNTQLVNALTNYINRHIQAFRELRARHIPAPSDRMSVFFSVTEPTVTLSYYVNRMVTYSKCSRRHFLVSMVYLDRISKKHISLKPSERNIHRLFTGSLAVAIQTNNILDETHCAKVSGVSTVQELRKIIDGFLYYVQYDTGVSATDMNRTFNELNEMKSSDAIAQEDCMSEVTDLGDENSNGNDGNGGVQDTGFGDGEAETDADRERVRGRNEEVSPPSMN